MDMDKETAKEEAKEIAIAQLNKRNTETVEVVLSYRFLRGASKQYRVVR